jgi:hypothetical protein
MTTEQTRPRPGGDYGFSDVFAELLSKRMRIANLACVFPGYEFKRKNRLGIVASSANHLRASIPRAPPL